MKLPQPTRDRCAAAIGDNSTHLEPVAVEQLRLLEGDPHLLRDKDVDLAADVLKQLPPGSPLPIVVNDKREVLAGAIFVLAAKKAGIETLLVVRHDGQSEMEQKHYAVAVNQLLTKGEWDPLGLEAWLREFEAGIEDFGHATIGFQPGELDRVLGLGALADGRRDERVPPVAGLAVSHHGQLWLLGRHRLACGSALSPADFEALVEGKPVDMTITDPPFGCKVDGFVSRKGLHRDFVEGAGIDDPAELEQFFAGFAVRMKEASRPGALVYVFIDWRGLSAMLRACEPVFGPLVQMCCWVKDRAGMGSFYRSQHELVLVFRVPGGKHLNNVKLGINGRNRSNAWQYPAAASSRSGREGDMLKRHPTPKGVEMIADAILDCTRRGDRVLDCFLGSGTTLIAAERTARTCLGMELDPLYVDVAVRRWQDWTGEQAIDAETGRTFDDLAAEAAASGEGGDDEG